MMVAQVGEEGYATVTEAVNVAASKGGKLPVILLEDVDEFVVLGKPQAQTKGQSATASTIVLDLNGHILKNTSAESTTPIQTSSGETHEVPATIYVSQGCNLTICDSKSDQSSLAKVQSNIKTKPAIYVEKAAVTTLTGASYIVKNGENDQETSPSGYSFPVVVENDGGDNKGQVVVSTNSKTDKSYNKKTIEPDYSDIVAEVQSNDPTPEKQSGKGENTETYVSVAKVGQSEFATLADAFKFVDNGQTITLLKDSEGDGIAVDGAKTFVVDFAGYKYTVTGNLAGSTGTKNQAFQFLKGNTVILKNGSILAGSNDIKILIQNYSNLTLHNMILDAKATTNNVQYVISNNCGSSIIEGNSIIRANDDLYAFDVYYWPNGGYPEGVSVTVQTTGTITGKIEYGSDGTVSADVFDKASLTVSSGMINGSLSVYNCNDNPNIKKTKSVTTFEAPEGYEWSLGSDNYYRLNKVEYQAKIDDTFYPTLLDAVNAVQNGQTINLIQNCNGNGISISSGKNFTLDFGGYTYHIDGETVGSAGTKTQAFQLLKNSEITFKNGTISSNKAKLLIQNYATLTLDHMTLDGSNLADETKTSYTLSTNNGHTIINNSTIIARANNGIAFDVCSFDAYTSNLVEVKDNSIIKGNIEVSTFNSVIPVLKLLSCTGEGCGIVFDKDGEKVDVFRTADVTTISAPNNYVWSYDSASQLYKLKEAVAKIGDVGYSSLFEAVNAVGNEETTIELTKSSAGCGIQVPNNKKVIFDFNGYTYTLDNSPTGSQGTKTQCFQLLAGSYISFKNGRIFANTKDCKIIIQNYSNLTLTDMTLDATQGENSVDYVLSNNFGNVSIEGSSSIIAKDGCHAFDLYYWPTGGYQAGVNVQVNTTGTIKGIIDYCSDGKGSAATDMYDKSHLHFENGNFENCTLYQDKCNSNPNITKKSNLTIAVPDGFTWTESATQGIDQLVKTSSGTTTGLGDWQ